MRRIISLVLLSVLTSQALFAQKMSKGTMSIDGYVSASNEGKTIPVEYAAVILNPAGLYAMTDKNGRYVFRNLDPGDYTISIQLIGYENVDSTIVLRRGGKSEFNFTLVESSFRLKEVNVVASRSKAGDATASIISRQAIDHSQTSSLQDIMQLLPGVELTNPDLSSTQSLSLRTAASTAMNSLGTSIIIDGAPVSNNANMESLSSSITGVSSTIAGSSVSSAGSIPNSGIDVRSISTDNIESVEVIRGIPSVQYGDLTSGAVIINSKAGIEPLTVRIKTNPKIFQGYISKGFRISDKAGDMHISGDYAYSNAKTTEAYAYYQRFNLKGMWTKRYGDLNSSTSLELKYGKDTRNRNHDDLSNSVSSGGTNIGYRFNTNGTWNINKGWLKSMRYDLSNSYTYKESFHEQDYVNAVSIYSTNMTDGTTLSNTAGRHIFDSAGNEITRFSTSQNNEYATYLPFTYFSHYDFYGKELNTYAKVTVNFFKNWSKMNNKILAGADFQSDGNLGAGLLFTEGAPPKNTSSESSYRERRLSDVPFVNQIGIFAEDSFKADVLGRTFNLSAGLRFDEVNSLTALSPRINASYDILPKVLTLRGGYGVTAKAPTSSFFYPEKAYYDQTNYNSLEAPDDKNKLLLATTYVFDRENDDLEIALNRKVEIGIDLTIAKKYRLAVTYYNELMENGYEMGNTFSSIQWMPYKYYSQTGTDAGGNPILELSRDTHKFFKYYVPMNTSYEKNTGVEWELNLGRFDAIRTSFYLNGAWMHTMNTTNGYTFDINSYNGSTVNSNVSVYDPQMRKYNYEKALTTLRITHNIPSIGFVLTLTSQLNLYAKNWTNYNNDVLPQQYISNENGQVHPFTQEMSESADYRYMLDQRSESRFITEKTKTTLVFNLNVSKEIKDFLTASFFVNNIFNSRPLDPSEVANGSYTELNNPIYFGFELKLNL